MPIELKTKLIIERVFTFIFDIPARTKTAASSGKGEANKIPANLILL